MNSILSVYLAFIWPLVRSASPACRRGLLVFLAAGGCLFGHQPGSSSLVLNFGSDDVLRGEYHIADVDLESVRLMREDRMTRNESAGTTHSAAAGSALGGLPWLVLRNGQGETVDYRVGPPQIVESETEDRPHTMFPFETRPIENASLEIVFEDFFDFDTRHRVVTTLQRQGDTKVGLLSIDEAAWLVSLETPGALGQFIAFTWEGVWHIWIGIDHILFLIALLLPSVVLFKNGRWVPVSGFRDAFITVLKVVTAFTIAHSITLSLASLKFVSLPSKWVEAVIALSVLLAALNNLYPVVRNKTWLVAFGFGLVHGFGFANVLADLALPGGTLVLALLSFNVGVELGQVVIVLLVFPFIFLLREKGVYRPLVLALGSTAIGLVATAWVVDRVWELEMMPF